MNVDAKRKLHRRRRNARRGLYIGWYRAHLPWDSESERRKLDSLNLQYMVLNNTDYLPKRYR